MKNLQETRNHYISLRNNEPDKSMRDVYNKILDCIAEAPTKNVAINNLLIYKNCFALPGIRSYLYDAINMLGG